MAARASASHLVKRQFQSDAVCDSSFSWAANSKQQTPCIAAAYVNGACGTNTYKVVKLLDNNRYDAPNATTANACTCSWASYNLLSACTACQNQPNSIPTWDAWIYECSNHVSDSTYFPQAITLPGGTSIPYYAGTNPKSWTNHQFDVNQAKALAAQGKGDLNPNTEEKKSKTPIGPIVGGVVGGLAVIGLAIGIALYLRKRRRNSPVQPYMQQSTTTYISAPSTIASPPPPEFLHSRSMSEISHKSLSYATSSAAMTLSPTSPPSLIMTHLSPAPTQYAQSISAFGGSLHGHSSSIGHTGSMHGHTSSIYGHSLFNSSPTSPTAPPLPLPGQQQSQGSSDLLSPENIIEPFRLEAPPPSHVRQASRSTEKGGFFDHIVYDSPSRPPGISSSEGSSSSDPTTPPRRRLNPPAYTPTDPASPMSAAQPLGSISAGVTPPPSDSAGPSSSLTPSAWSNRVDQKIRRWKSAASTQSHEGGDAPRGSNPAADLTRSLSVGSSLPPGGTPDLSIGQDGVHLGPPSNLSRAPSLSTIDDVLDDMGFGMRRQDSYGGHTVATGYSRDLSDDPPPAFPH
ncbi:hypothetical protein HGRIS_014740 [Hohenbuehelia grisea]|uniref:Uncharacterized protein n=1 Tax=Hohenbuehelia grisea TaxID=104357 RepID=A0ABR3IQJ9_9AGAR